MAAIANILILFSVFALAVVTHRRSTTIYISDLQTGRLEIATRLIALITFSSYAIWFAVGVFRGLSVSMLFSALTGQGETIYLLKSVILAPIGGVTTWSQLAVILGPLLVIRWRLTNNFPAVMFLVLLGTVTFRALFFSERLALIEVGVSTLMAWALIRSKPLAVVKTPIRWLATWAGSLGLLVAVFALFEYPRSWLTYYAARYDGNILDFAAQRLLGYYSTALNNGSLKAQTTSELSIFGLLQGRFSLPFVGSWGEEIQASNESFSYALNSGSNPEFNNVSGLLLTDAALGRFASLISWVVFGFVIVWIANRASRGGIVALVAYCSLAISVLEVVRIYYVGTSRFLPIIIALLFLNFYLGRSDNQSALSTHSGKRSNESDRFTGSVPL
ncbi:hypothetical protein EU811_09365 [Arthrobacter sp. TS-15]|nr:hypothetical protein EU811_09365 [Arthrobacter sp. TS-15]